MPSILGTYARSASKLRADGDPINVVLDNAIFSMKSCHFSGLQFANPYAIGTDCSPVKE
jgi:hypothetical protein